MQKIINALAYPPTHTYVLPGTATGVLKERVEAFHKIAPWFWRGGDHLFLDVGCNKGFFSLQAADSFAGVVGIDPVAGYVDLCRELLPDETFIHAGFRDYVPRHQFGRVLIGNGHHYLFREARGWAWIKKLAVITAPQGLVLVEGIRNADDVEGTKFPGLSEVDFLAAMAPYFELKADGPSVDYTPDRKIWLFERRDDSLASYLEYVPTGVLQRLGRQDVASIRKQGDLITKTYWPAVNIWPRVAIASLMNQATLIEHWITRNGNMVGWAEKNLGEAAGRGDVVPLTNYLLELISVGYFDCDLSPHNVVAGQLVDKNGVWPIAELGQAQYGFINGSMGRSLRRAGLAENTILALCSALATRDAEKIRAEVIRWDQELR